MAWLKPLRSSVAPDATVNALAEENASAAAALQRAGVDGGGAGVAGRAGQRQRADADLGQRAGAQMEPANAAELPSVSMVPPGAMSVIERALVTAAVVCSVPPLKVSVPDEVEAAIGGDRQRALGDVRRRHRAGGAGQRPGAGAGLLVDAEALILRGGADVRNVEARVGAAAENERVGRAERGHVAVDGRAGLRSRGRLRRR